MKYFSTVMGSSFFLLCALLVVAQVGPAPLVQAQQQLAAANATPIVPPLVNFSGVLTDLDGRPMTGVVGVTFLLYKDAQGGAPLWLETQNMRLDRTGHYTAMLGSASSHGLPAEIFVAGEAHWLGVQVSGQAEQPRVLLVSAPYALKAGDAETVGGFPASAFMLAAPAAGPGTAGAAAARPQSASVAVTSRDRHGGLCSSVGFNFRHHQLGVVSIGIGNNGENRNQHHHADVRARCARRGHDSGHAESAGYGQRHGYCWKEFAAAEPGGLGLQQHKQRGGESDFPMGRGAGGE